MAYIDPDRPPQSLRNRPDDYVIGSHSDIVGRTMSGCPIYVQVTYFIHQEDYGVGGEPLKFPAYLTRPNPPKAVLHLADDVERRWLQKVRDEALAGYLNDARHASRGLCG